MVILHIGEALAACMGLKCPYSAIVLAAFGNRLADPVLWGIIMSCIFRKPAEMAQAPVAQLDRAAVS